ATLSNDRPRSRTPWTKTTGCGPSPVSTTWRLVVRDVDMGVGIIARLQPAPPSRARHDGPVPSNLTWREVAERLAPASIFWLHTTGPSGAPDAAPVWGVVVGEQLYFYTERSTVKARNIERDPRVLVHLESGADVVIVRGILTDLGRPDQRPDVV